MLTIRVMGEKTKNCKNEYKQNVIYRKQQAALSVSVIMLRLVQTCIVTECKYRRVITFKIK